MSQPLTSVCRDKRTLIHEQTLKELKVNKVVCFAVLACVTASASCVVIVGGLLSFERMPPRYKV